MTITLEERLERAAEVLDREAVDTHLSPTARPRGAALEPRSFFVQVAAVCIVVIGLVGTAWALSRTPAASPVGSAPDGAGTVVPSTATTTAVARQVVPTTAATVGTVVPPAATLPELADVRDTVPATVMGTGPSEWYRLAPDLDVAWYSEGSGAASMLCFRTPAGSLCLPDEFAPAAAGGGPIAVRSVDGQVLVVTLEPDVEVSVTFDDGEVRTAPVAFDPQIGWGVGRVQGPDASSPVGLSMWFEIPPVASTTLPTLSTAPDTTFAAPNTTAPTTVATSPPVTPSATTAPASTSATDFAN